MRKYLNPDTIANEIRMTRGQYKGAFLLVEGSTDALLFERLTKKKCKVRFSNGKDNAIKIIEILESVNFKGVLAVVDADFWIANAVKIPSPNILITDGHDMETMLIFSKALDNFLAEFGSIEYLRKVGTSVRDILISLAMPIGILRLLSTATRNDLHLKFQGIQYAKFLDFARLSVDIRQMVTEVISNSGSSNTDIGVLSTEIKDQLSKKGNMIEHICSGDDLIEILTLGLAKVFGNFRSKGLNQDNIRAILRLTFDNDCFVATKLHRSIERWESLNPNFEIL